MNDGRLSVYANNSLIATKTAKPAYLYDINLEKLQYYTPSHNQLSGLLNISNKMLSGVKDGEGIVLWDTFVVTSYPLADTKEDLLDLIQLSSLVDDAKQK